MKTHEITTSKGEFVVVDYNYNTHRQDLYSLDIDILQRVGYINNITEEDASKVVEKSEAFQLYRNYTKAVEFGNKMEFTSAIESLHSLLTSKGIDINNGNWYLFKKLK